jgi:hypothetical protein
MSPERIDRFVGTPQEYREYLCRQLLDRLRFYPPDQLEEMVLEVRRRNPGHTLQIESSNTSLASNIPTQSQQQNSQPKKQWERELGKFLVELPCPDTWDAVRQNLGLGPGISLSHVLNRLLCGGSGNILESTTSDAIDVSRHSALLQPAYRFASLTRQCRKEAHLAGALSCFREILLASYCYILKHVESDQAAAEVMKCAHLSETTVNRYYAGARWVNQQINTLYSRDWGDRATELFLICEHNSLSTIFLRELTWYRPSHHRAVWPLR